MTIDDTLAILRDHVSDSSLLQAIARDLIAAEKEDKAAKEPTSKSKTILKVLIRGDSALKAMVAAGGYILSVPDDDSVSNTYMADGLLGRITTACRTHNDAPKQRRGKKRRQIKTLNEAMVGLKSKVIKQSGSAFTIKGKGIPCEIVVVEKEELL